MRASLSIALFLVAGGIAGVQAQSFGRIEETKSNVAYYFHATPGTPTVQVSMWGTIPQPGIYEVPDTTELDKLLTMAGGIPMEVREKGRDEPRITVRLYRPDKKGRSKIFEAPIDSMLQRSRQYPSLRDGDIVVIETIRSRAPFGWRDVLSIASTVGTLALLGLRIFRLSN